MNIRSVCVYCGSSNRAAEEYKQAARDCGRLLAENGIRLVYGGGASGLMGIVADGALAAGGLVTGIIPYHLKRREVGHDGVTELLTVDSMHTRKRLMADQADAFVVLPGGFGTMDETFEVLTWKQLDLHDLPIVLVNINGYWDKFLALVDDIIEQKFAASTNRQLFTVVKRVEDILPALAKAPLPMVDVQQGQL